MSTQELKTWLSTTSLVLSIIWALLCISVIGIVFGIPVSIAALIIGIIALVQKQQKSMAIIGIVISWVFILATGILLTISIMFFRKNADVFLTPAKEFTQMIQKDPQLVLLMEDPNFNNQLQYILKDKLIARYQDDQIDIIKDWKNEIDFISKEIQNTVSQLKSTYLSKSDTSTISNFQQCVDAGYPTMESYPEQCMTTDGQVFVNQIKQMDIPKSIQWDANTCQVDQDCIPLPSDCHPTSCINKQYESNYTKPEMCTMMFMIEAAYNAEDCICQQNICTNKNLGRTTIGE